LAAETRGTRKLRHWLQAARPLAQANILPPLLLGQGLAHAVCGNFSLRAFFIAFAFGVLLQLFIVFANDCADWRSDVQNRTYNLFSGGSRVVPEGKLTPLSLARAAGIASIALVALVVWAGFALKLPLLLFFAAGSVGLVWAYSFPPLRLSYRGRGELLQALGVGAVLPAVGFYLQCGAISPLPWPALLPPMLLAWASNLTTSLPDFPSDRATGKNSYPVRRGELAARRAALFAIALGAAGAPLVVPRAASPLLVGFVALPFFLLIVNRRNLADADAQNARACKRFVALNAGAITAALLGWTVALFWV
jgi:1,4-dihydroxy-2-naphthoate polyprenyltransferase